MGVTLPPERHAMLRPLGAAVLPPPPPSARRAGSWAVVVKGQRAKHPDRDVLLPALRRLGLADDVSVYDSLYGGPEALVGWRGARHAHAPGSCSWKLELRLGRCERLPSGLHCLCRVRRGSGCGRRGLIGEEGRVVRLRRPTQAQHRGVLHLPYQVSGLAAAQPLALASGAAATEACGAAVCPRPGPRTSLTVCCIGCGPTARRPRLPRSSALWASTRCWRRADCTCCPRR
jgi:hypothetical protein